MRWFERTIGWPYCDWCLQSADSQHHESQTKMILTEFAHSSTSLSCGAAFFHNHLSFLFVILFISLATGKNTQGEASLPHLCAPQKLFQKGGLNKVFHPLGSILCTLTHPDSFLFDSSFFLPLHPASRENTVPSTMKGWRILFILRVVFLYVLFLPHQPPPTLPSQHRSVSENKELHDVYELIHIQNTEFSSIKL